MTTKLNNVKRIVYLKFRGLRRHLSPQYIDGIDWLSSVNHCQTDRVYTLSLRHLRVQAPSCWLK